MLSGITFVILGALFFGISNVYWKIAGRNLAFANLVFFRGLISSSFFGLLWFYIIKTDLYSIFVIQDPTNLHITITVIICLVCSLGLVFFLKSLSSSPASITIPISSINIFGILTAVIVLSETFKTVQAISFLLAFVGILLVNSFSFKHDTLKWNVGATYALLASFFWGVTYTLFKYSALWLGVVPLAFILELCVTIVALVWLLFSSKDLKDEFTITFSKLKQYTILAALLIGGTIFLNLALLKLPVLLVNIFFNSNIIISVLFARIVYRELITRNQRIGILFIISSMLVSHIVK